jgi:hypothetical protein
MRKHKWIFGGIKAATISEWRTYHTKSLKILNVVFRGENDEIT